MSAISDFVDGFAVGWDLMDGFLKDREKRIEEDGYDAGLVKAMDAGGDRATSNFNNASRADDTVHERNLDRADPSEPVRDPSLPGEQTNYGDPSEAWDATVDPSLPGERTPYDPAERVNRTTPMDITPEGNPGPRVEYTGTRGSARLDPNLVGFAEDMARVSGRPLTVTSGYRDPDLNREVGGVENSHHLTGRAIDLRTRGQSPDQLRPVLERAARQGYLEHGVTELRDVGRYKPGKDHAHLQVEEGYRYHPERPPMPPRRPSMAADAQRSRQGAIPAGYGGAAEQVRRQVGSWDDLTPDMIAEHVAQVAPSMGIDPDAAMDVIRAEGIVGDRVHGQSQIPNPRGPNGREDSWGPFQLYRGGGLGNEFMDETGLDPADPSTWREQIDFSLGRALQRGNWDPWHGVRDQGYPRNHGLPGRERAAIPLQPTLMAATGGKVEAQSGKTTWQSQAPNMQGSVFLKHQTQRPTQTTAGPNFSSQSQSALPTTGNKQRMSYADRFRELRANRAQYTPREEATATKSAYEPDEFDSRLYWQDLRTRKRIADDWYRNENQQFRSRTRFMSPDDKMQAEAARQWGPYDAHPTMQYERLHMQHGLRTDPTETYLVKPPSSQYQNSDEWREYLRLPKAEDEFVYERFDPYRWNR